MSVAAALLEDVLARVAAGEADDASFIAKLRECHAGVHFTLCNDDDIPPRLSPVAENQRCRLYYVSSSSHCLSLCDDAAAASGLVVALHDGDDD